MLRFVILVAIMSVSRANPARETCVGCPIEQDVNDPEILKKVQAALATVNTPEKVDKILSIKTQIVAGTKYIVQFQTKEGKTCETSWVEQVWISDIPKYVDFKCL